VSASCADPILRRRVLFEVAHAAAPRHHRDPAHPMTGVRTNTHDQTQLKRRQNCAASNENAARELVVAASNENAARETTNAESDRMSAEETLNIISVCSKAWSH
jgi:hypothetical protein